MPPSQDSSNGKEKKLFLEQTGKKKEKMRDFENVTWSSWFSSLEARVPSGIFWIEITKFLYTNPMHYQEGLTMFSSWDRERPVDWAAWQSHKAQYGHPGLSGSGGVDVFDCMFIKVPV